MSARPSRTLGRLATMVTVVTGQYRSQGAASVPRAHRHAELAQLTPAHHRGAHRGADAVWSEQPLQVVGVADRRAIQFDENIALEHPGCRRRTAFGYLDDQQAALLAAGEV